MPNWEPNWNDVRWNYAAAAAASAALGQAAQEIDALAGERARAAVANLSEWRGNHRISFDERLRRADIDDQALAGDLRRTAQIVGQASEQARAEQARRERERAEWERECERERERDRAPTPAPTPAGGG